MYKIKQVVDDFVVEEIPVIKPKESGRHILFLLEKRNISTQSAVSILRSRFKLKPSEIGYAGLKDKFAITRQFITIKRRKFLTKDFDFNNFSLKFMGFSDERLLFGNLLGNKFKIIIRNVNDVDIERLRTFKQNSFLFPNYFGEQRFSKQNYPIGIEILHQDFEKALKTIIKYNRNSWLNKKLNEHLIKYKNDFLGSLRILPREILLLYIHSFQSFIFNKVLSSSLNGICSNKFNIEISGLDLTFSEQDCLKRFKMEEIPLVGFGSETNQNEFWNKTLKKSIEIMASFGINKQDFIIKKVPDLSLEGSSRKAVVKAENFKFSIDNDEFNKSMKKAVLQFELPKGSYATVAIRELFSA